MEITAILAIIQAAAALLPELAQIVPIVEAAIAGQTLTDAQLETLASTRQAIEAKVLAQAAPAAP